jgi:hypothetical protein
MPDDPEQGLATAARLALAEGGAPPGSEGEQLDLADLLGLPPAPSSNGAGLPARRSGSRAGIRNRRTEEWLEYFSGRGLRLPLENLMAMANLGVDEVRRRLGCTPLEAMNVIIRCNAEAAPFLHARLASIELKRPGEPGGRPSTLSIEGELAIDVTPEPPPDQP